MNCYTPIITPPIFICKPTGEGFVTARKVQHEAYPLANKSPKIYTIPIDKPLDNQCIKLTINARCDSKNRQKGSFKIRLKRGGEILGEWSASKTEAITLNNVIQFLSVDESNYNQIKVEMFDIQNCYANGNPRDASIPFVEVAVEYAKQ